MTDDEYCAHLSDGAWQTGSELTIEKMIDRAIKAIKYAMN
jgi:hypothetical protein